MTNKKFLELAMKLYPFSNSERNAFITGYNKAKEMEKERIENSYNAGYNNGVLDTCLTSKQYYDKTYGGGNK
jgi:hypothetical protein